MAFPTTTEAGLSAKVDLFLSIPETVVFFWKQELNKGRRHLAFGWFLGNDVARLRQQDVAVVS